jgi:hypothetical protein
MMMTLPELESHARRVATEQAASMRRQLEDLTPAQMGYGDMTADELVAREYRTWFAEEMRLAALIPHLQFYGCHVIPDLQFFEVNRPGSANQGSAKIDH